MRDGHGGITVGSEISGGVRNLFAENCRLDSQNLDHGLRVKNNAMRGGLLPVVSFSGPALAFLITGTVVVEKIFALPGLGNYFINACFNRDEPLIIGIVAFIAIAVLVFNLLVDIAYGFIDPRIRYT